MKYCHISCLESVHFVRHGFISSYAYEQYASLFKSVNQNLVTQVENMDVNNNRRENLLDDIAPGNGIERIDNEDGIILIVPFPDGVQFHITFPRRPTPGQPLLAARQSTHRANNWSTTSSQDPLGVKGKLMAFLCPFILIFLSMFVYLAMICE